MERLKKTLATALSAALALLGPCGGLASAAQIVAPRVIEAPLTAGGGVAGAGLSGAGASALGGLSWNPSLTGSLPSLPGAALPTPVGTRNLGLPVAPALLQQTAGVSLPSAGALETARTGVSAVGPRVQAARTIPAAQVGSRGIAPGAKEVFKGAPEAADRQSVGVGRRLLQALNLPSLFRHGVPKGSEDARKTAEDDFALHIGGEASEVAAVPETPQASPSARLNPAVTVNGGVSAEGRENGGLPGGTLVLQAPVGEPEALRIQAVHSSLLKPGPGPVAGTDPAVTPAPESIRTAEPGRPGYRSAYFPLLLTALSGAAYSMMSVMPIFVDKLAALGAYALGAATTASAPVLVQAVLGAAAGVVGVSTALLGAYAAWDLGLFAVAVARGKPVTEAEFWKFAGQELQKWDLHPSVAAGLLGTGPGRGLLRVYRPQNRFAHLAFGFSANDAIYLRPELIRVPWLFRWTLKHELAHLGKPAARAPPGPLAGLTRLASFLSSELRSRVSEFSPVSSFRGLRLPILERALQEAKVSLRLPSEYEALIIHPGRHETRNPEIYKELSQGKARIVELLTGRASGDRSQAQDAAKKASFQTFNDPLVPAAQAGDPFSGNAITPDGESLADYLSQPANHERFRLIVYPQSFGAVPAPMTEEERRLQSTLRQLDEIHFLMQRLKAMGAAAFRDGSPERRQLETLAGQVLGKSVRHRNAERKLESTLKDMLNKASRKGLNNITLTTVLTKLYAAMETRGVVILPFAMDEAGMDTVQRVLRYWRAGDGGSFSVSRADLPEGGHVLVARKAEPRVDLWLKTKDGGSIDKSVTRVFNQSRAEQEAYLRKAGFTEDEVKRFREAGLILKHVFGPEHGDRLFVSVRRSHAKALKRFGEDAGIQFQGSQGGYELHLIQSGPLQNAPAVWGLGLTGEGGKIYDIDTGLDTTHPDFADRSLKSVDFVDEGPEDWIGHGTHKAGISYANGTLYKGMAPKAEGRMGKVFAQNGFGANDGDIMAAAVDAMQWGADVISLSLGSPGSVDAKLAEFFSNLTKQKNSKGRYPIVTGSAGNAGPFNSTKSQPSVGEYVTSVAAAAKSLDDGDPEISFYSSVGPALYQKFGRKRFRRPMGLTALGGDVTTPPGVKDVYEHGIESVKSKDMAPSPSDASDGLHTRMSGTSMSNPMAAGFALLVKQAAERVIKPGTAAHDFFFGNLPFAVNMILMRSAKDLRVPIYFQEAGFVDGLAAVKLAAESFGGSLSTPRRLARFVAGKLGLDASPKADSPAPWDWIRRARALWDLEDRIYQAAEEAKTAAVAAAMKAGEKGEQNDSPAEDPDMAAALKQSAGDAGSRAFDAKFGALRAEALPEILKALKDEVWLVRLYAAFSLLNLRAADAVLPLTDVAFNDADARVRQTASLALGEIGSYAADEALKAGLLDVRADVRIYAAYVLARHGDLSGVGKIIAETRSDDKKVRFTAVWLLGQLRQRAPPEAVDALASRVNDLKERGNIQHVAAASLTEIATAQPASVTDGSLLAALNAAGPRNFALTRTVSKFFLAAARSEEIRSRMAEEPLRTPLARFVEENKAAANRPGALGELVQLFAKILSLPLDMPTPVPSQKGEGVPGVDPSLGPVHLLVELPAAHAPDALAKAAQDGVAAAPTAGSAKIQSFQDFRTPEGRAALPAALGAAGLDLETLQRFDGTLQVAMPLSQSLWVSMPDAKVTAFSAEMGRRGYRVTRAGPMYRFLHETAPASGLPEARDSRGLSGKGVLVAYLDEGGDTKHPGIAGDRIRSTKNFTDDGGPAEVEDEDVSHGTHGMGIVGGASVDGSPYVGMAPGVDFAIGKVLGRFGGSMASVMAGIEWAASLVADPLKTPVIINMSLGGPAPVDNPMNRLVNSLRLKNIGVVTAAGNAGPTEGTVSSPANAPLSIAVGAVDKGKRLADYSSRSPKGEREISWVDFGGGVFFGMPNPYEIVSMLNTKLAGVIGKQPTGVLWKGQALYHTMSGTSMAAPHTTGKLALLTERMMKTMSERIGHLPDGYLFYIEELVERTAVKLGNAENEVGAGLIDEARALAALDSALQNPDQVISDSASLIRAAREKYGQPPAPVPPQRAAGFARSLSGIVAGLWSNLVGLGSLFLLR